MSYRPKILIVDDDPRMCESLRVVLSGHGYEIQTANSGHEAMEYLNIIAFDLVLLDITLPDMDGYQVIDFINDEGSNTSVIIVTGYASTDSAVKALRKGVRDYIKKPFEPDALLVTVGNILDQTRLISERKKTEETNGETKKLLENILDSSSAISIISTDLEQNVVFWNKGAEKIFGYKAEEIIGRQKISIIYSGEEEKKLTRKIRLKILKDKKGLSFEIREVTKDGRKLWVNLNVTPRFDEEGHVIGILGIGEDITERKRAEEALQASEKRFKEMADLLPTVICGMDNNLCITYLNNAGHELFGYTQDDLDAGLVAMDLIHPDEREKVANRFEQTMKGANLGANEYRLLRKDGTEIVAFVDSAPIYKDGQMTGIRVSLADITEQKQLQARLQQAHKMEAIATLAGGIAHRFNNALSVITLNLDLLKMDLSDEVNVDAYFKQMKSSADKMSQLTLQLLAYARGGKYQPKTILLNNFVENTLPIIQHVIDPSVRVEMNLETEKLNVKADLIQMQMVLCAILQNASEAIEGKGLIRVLTREKVIDEEFIKHHQGIKTGRYACLIIKDDGKGMDEMTTSRVFDPFFTTKIQGRGLGMAAAYGIVKNHDGWISVDSELAKGTTVHIYLPAFEEASVKEHEKPKIEPGKGAGTILVIEDEKRVMDLSQALLERLGFRVLGAKTGEEATNIAKTFDGDIDLAILDNFLHDMEGKVIYPRLMEARPNLKVIVCSGYLMDSAQEVLDAGAQGFIQKPFTLETLSEKLKKVLESK